MTHAAGTAVPGDSPILYAAVSLGAQIREASEAIERGRRITPEIASRSSAPASSACRCRAPGADRNWIR